MSSTIEQTLAERGKRYGEYREHARITQSLKAVMRGEKKFSQLAPHQQETLDMIAHKIGRILNGDPNWHDSWHDIVGYSKLSADELLKPQEDPSQVLIPGLPKLRQTAWEASPQAQKLMP